MRRPKARVAEMADAEDLKSSSIGQFSLEITQFSDLAPYLRPENLALLEVIAKWHKLPAHLQETILTLVRSIKAE